jgi:hypothetical protein
MVPREEQLQRRPRSVGEIGRVRTVRPVALPLEHAPPTRETPDQRSRQQAVSHKLALIGLESC